MESELVEKEEEFRRQNALIEEERKKLFQQVDDVMKTQELFLQEPVFTKKTSSSTMTECNSFKKPTTVEDLNLPKSVNDRGTKGMLHFYKAKLKSLQIEHGQVHHELKNKTEELKKVTKDLQCISEEKEKCFLQYTSERNNHMKVEKQISAYISKLQMKDSENLAMKKELEQLKVQYKTTQNDLDLMENRFNRTLVECDKAKNALKQVKLEEKEIRAAHKREIKELASNLKSTEKHKSEILQAFKRQMLLIDNLKKQKDLIESIKISELAESEYGKILNWKVDR